MDNNFIVILSIMVLTIVTIMPNKTVLYPFGEELGRRMRFKAFKLAGRIRSILLTLNEFLGAFSAIIAGIIDGIGEEDERDK